MLLSSFLRGAAVGALVLACWCWRAGVGALVLASWCWRAGVGVLVSVDGGGSALRERVRCGRVRF